MNIIDPFRGFYDENNPLRVVERQFWVVLLKMWSLNIKLTDKTIDVFSHILTKKDPHLYFRNDFAEVVRNELNISSSELSRVKKILVENGLLVSLDKRGKVGLSKQLSGVKTLLEKNNIISFKLDFSIETKS